MPLVLSAGSQAATRDQTVLDRIVGLVPVEVVSIYAAVARLGVSASQLGYVALAGLVATALTLWLQGRATRRTAYPAQYLVRGLVFLAWVFLLSNPLAPASPIAAWQPAVAVLMLPVLGSLLFMGPSTR